MGNCRHENQKTIAWVGSSVLSFDHMVHAVGEWVSETFVIRYK